MEAAEGHLTLKMENGPALSTAKSGKIYVGSEMRDSFTMLDILHADQFEGETLDPELTEKAEENFYKGAPPSWLNFHIGEQSVSDGTGTPLIKRDGYEKLKEQILQKRKLPVISTVKLFHQPGCGGTTMAMQVLWDLRKTFRCAVMISSTADISKVAKEVVDLFTAGSQKNQNTVLLLLNNEQILENLQDLQTSIMMITAEQKIVTNMPVVILLSCVRNNSALQSDHVVLENTLSDTEKQKFSEKKKELTERYKDKCKQFHGFNILQNNFSQDYIRQACSVLSLAKKANRPPKMQLVAFLSLLNAYVPGSYLLESQCLDFLKQNKYGEFSLEDQMQPFSHLIITFQDERSERKVHMAHTMIAQYCTELMADAGVARSDTARNFLNYFCSNLVPPCLLGFVKDMLTKREKKKEETPRNGKNVKEEKERFSRLILDITNMEIENGKRQSVSVLNLASKKFDQNPFFPQVLARFYYIELKNYYQAEIWAKEATRRDPQNSFVADTLGQVYKNLLKNTKDSAKAREILQQAKRAIDAFEFEEKLAEDEQGPDMKENGNAKFSQIFNSRGMFGYLQVCNILYDKLVRQNDTWKRVLTKEVSMHSVLKSVGDNELSKFTDLIVGLRDKVEKKCIFFEKYLTYSKPKMEKSDPEYIFNDTKKCYRKYVGDQISNHTQLIEVLIENLPDTSEEVLSCLVMSKHIQSEIQKKSETPLQINSIRAAITKKMPLSQKDVPELHLLALILHWPICNLSQLAQSMHCSYEHAYKKYFRSRYLCPLFFIGKGEDQNRIVHRKDIAETISDGSFTWDNESIFENPEVQDLLLKLDGVVRNYRLYANVGGKEIEMAANVVNRLWKPRQVTFYLGFTIRGPVAFGIQTKNADNGHLTLKMENGPALSTAKSGKIYVGSEMRDSFTMLDILHADQFEGETLDPELTEKAEKNFYRGAPPSWLNFHIGEQSVSDGTGTPLIKRDGYEKLKEQILQKRKLPVISTVKLFHQPGCGRTTMAMQVLWDLRKTFRCAVMISSTADISKVAKEVVDLFTAGSQKSQNTVLLLLNNEQILENLQDLQTSIMMITAEQKIVTNMPVVILLSCVRNNSALQSDHVVLENTLSDTEKQKFSEKKKELTERYKDKCKQFHGFNILQNNFSQDYIRQACSVLSLAKKANRPPKMQLVAFLSLLNAYVPGSYLLESQCLDFLKQNKYGEFSLEDQMQPFSHLIITFQDERSERKVHMAHTMIAQYCTELMADAGVARSDTARNFLNYFCSNLVPPCLLGFVKDMLTKREKKKEETPRNGEDVKEEKERFSRLILDITNMEIENGKRQSVSVLKVASKKFDQNPFFPQALARFYYIELKNYSQAEIWAKEAKRRDPQNSFVADTLGQVYKNCLKNTKDSAKAREILQQAKRAIDAFEFEEKLAEDEQGPDMKENGNAKFSQIFNSRGMFGYLQVCNILYDKLVRQNDTWKRVLTKEVSMHSVIESLEETNLFRFTDLIVGLRDKVEKKCIFFEKYLTYSKPKMEKSDPEYIFNDTKECYQKYVGDQISNHTQLIEVLIENLPDTSEEVLSCLIKEYIQSEIQKKSETPLQINSIRAAITKKMPLSQKDVPELHLLALILHWPICNLSQLAQSMYCSYEHAYKKYFRSRYLCPLFFIGKGEDQDLIVHRKVIAETISDGSFTWDNESIFENPEVQDLLLKLDGVVRNYRLYANVGGKEIEMAANVVNRLWKPRQVTFYLGFTIRGPVAFGIQTKNADNGQHAMDHKGTALTTV